MTMNDGVTERERNEANSWMILTITRMVMSPALKLKAAEAYMIARHLRVLTGKPWYVRSRLEIAQRIYQVRPGESPDPRTRSEGNQYAGGTI